MTCCVIPVSSKGGGQCMAFPDVCKVPAPPSPPIPTPFPNLGQMSSAKKAVKKVKVCQKHALVKSSTLNSTSGDEAGTLKGMVSNSTRGKATYKNASSKVKFKGKPAAKMGAMMSQNGTNAPTGAQVAPSQMKVFLSM